MPRCVSNDDDFSDDVRYSDLPPRLIHILVREDILRISTLARMTDGEISLIRNVGPDYLQQIRTLLGREKRGR